MMRASVWANTLRVGGRARAGPQRGAGLVELDGVVLGGLVAVALVGHHVDQGH